MKRIILRGLAYLALSSVASAQHYCIGNFQKQDSALSEQLLCYAASPAFHNYFRHQGNYIPDSNTAIKTLDVAIHVWRDNDGLGNWQDTPGDRQKLEAYISRVSFDLLTFNDSPSDPIPGVPFIQDTRLRLNLVDIFYYDDNNYHCSRAGSAMNERAIALNPEAAEYINIHMSGDTSASYAFSSNSRTINWQTGRLSAPHEYIWTGYRGDGYGLGDGALETDSTYFADGPIAQLLTHELGHTLGLCHTYCCANCYESTDTNSLDFLDDVFTPPHYNHHFYSWTADAYSNDNTATNNIMGGNKSAGYFSPKQMGRIHRELRMDKNIRRYARGYSRVPMEVDSNVTWDFQFKMYQDLVIKQGATLTLKCELVFVPEAKLIIEPGAKLIIEGGTLTKAEFEDYWQGVYVAGNSAAGQTEADQGKIVINSGEISYALNGITNINIDSQGHWIWGSTGGIIRCNNAHFINNQRDVQLLAYTPPYAKNESYDAYFKNCTFLRRNDSYSLFAMSPSITMWGVADIDILACTFDNRLKNHLKYQGGAIYSQRASYTVGELNNRGCLFKGYADAIRSEDDFSISFPIKIIGARFEDNIHGVYLNDAQGARVSHNEFLVRTQHSYIPPSNQNFQAIAYGLYLDYSNGFAIEDNEFVNLDGASSLSAAIVVKDNGGATDQLYHNEIDGFYFGIQAIGNNQNSALADFGLNFICNDCGASKANGKDIVVSQYGKVGNLQGEGSRLPNNRFSPHALSRHFDNYGLHTITYEYGTGDPRVVPVNYSGLNVINPSKQAQWQIKCPSIPKPEALPGAVLTELNAVENGLSNDRALLAQLLDQGNTPQLEAQILFASNQWEYQKVYIDLMNTAPFVSTDVLLQLIRIEDYPELALRNVLLANPHAIREGDVWEALINRSPLLSQQTIDDLETGKQSITGKDLLDRQIAGKQVLSEKLSGQYLRYYAEHSDTTAFDAIAMIKQHLQNRDELHYKYALIDLHLSLNEWALARQELEDIPQQCAMGEQEEMDFQNMQSYYNLFLDGNLVESQLDEERLESLRAIVESGSGSAVGRARALLKLNGHNVSYVEPILDQNGLLLHKASIDLQRPQYPIQNFGLYPNPARDGVALQWETKKLGEGKLVVQIRNSSGQLVWEQRIGASQNSFLINLENWKPGLYLLQVFEGEAAIYQEKLIVQP